MFRNVRKRAERRGYPIHGYVGANGGGKTCAMVWDTLPSLETGRPVLSTVRLLDYANPRPCDDPLCGDPEHEVIARWAELDEWGVPVPPPLPSHMAAHPLWVPFTEWSQLLEAEKCDVLMDEVTGVASSRESQGLPAAVANTLVQMRRRDVQIRWTAPAWARADKIIRECSQAVTYCEGYLSKPSSDADRLWRQRRLFRWRTFDANAFEDFTAGKREKLDRRVVDLHWGPNSPAFAAYDTLDAVLTIGTVDGSGRCETCGGRRTAPECSCADYTRRRVHDKALGKALDAEARRVLPLVGVPAGGETGGGYVVDPADPFGLG